MYETDEDDIQRPHATPLKPTLVLSNTAKRSSTVPICTTAMPRQGHIYE